jgi:hypothetical protein
MAQPHLRLGLLKLLWKALHPCQTATPTPPCPPPPETPKDRSVAAALNDPSLPQPTATPILPPPLKLHNHPEPQMHLRLGLLKLLLKTSHCFRCSCRITSACTRGVAVAVSAMTGTCAWQQAYTEGTQSLEQSCPTGAAALTAATCRPPSFTFGLLTLEPAV